MAVQGIQLAGGNWTLDDAAPLGPAGGFGEVFRGAGAPGEVAIKRLRLTADAAAHRELAVGDRLNGREMQHVVPILDLGQDAETDRYYLVMPVCDGSLQQHIEKTGPLPYGQLRDIVLQIIAGLQEVGDLVHRDLKPANILFLNGIWAIADFGIAKFVEDSTSLQTLRESLTPSFAAPEQWKNERPTAATDVYALGCIVHALATGRPPFTGDLDGVRKGHLTGAVPTLDMVPPRVAALVTTMLRKPQEARPSLARCAAVFRDVEEVGSAGGSLAALAEAGKNVATIQAANDAKAAAEAEQRATRRELATAAVADMNRMAAHLLAQVTAHSEGARVEHGRLFFGEAFWHLKSQPAIYESHDGSILRNSGWDVAAWALVALRQGGGGRQYYEWSATLLYADRRDGMGFRWYEVGLFELLRTTRDEPFGLPPNSVDLDFALSRVAHSFVVAYGPVPIDAEDEENFFDRWSHLIARAALGRLARPDRMPFDPATLRD